MSDDTPVGAGADTRFISVGIDVGSSTTHLTLSELRVGRPESVLYGKPEVLGRRVLWRSPIIFTPFRANGEIDDAAIGDFLARSLAEAGVRGADIGAGAVICTGEAARRNNARALTAALARDSGRFVCATAGHRYEAILAAHGSGAVEASRHVDTPVVCVDIGGGTTKRALLRDGAIIETAAINVGARLIAFDAAGRVVRVEEAGRAIARAAGFEPLVGDSLAPRQREAWVDVCVDLLVGFIGVGKSGALAEALMLTAPPSALSSTLIQSRPPRLVPDPFHLVFSGGVSEFIYGDGDVDPLDFGPAIGAALRRRVRGLLPDERVLAPAEGIRATVIGACQHTLQVSGDTVFVSRDGLLPLRNVPVRVARLDWNAISAGAAERATLAALESVEAEGVAAVFFGGAKFTGYGRVGELARGVAAALALRPDIETFVPIFARDIANTFGAELKRLAPGRQLVCLDEIVAGDLDFLDLDAPPPGETYLPAIVKSLVFDAGR